jgi:hypothetical protein
VNVGSLAAGAGRHCAPAALISRNRGEASPPPDQQTRPSATPDVWRAMGCMLIGLWALTTTIPRLVYDYFAFNAMSSYEDRSR